MNKFPRYVTIQDWPEWSSKRREQVNFESRRHPDILNNYIHIAFSQNQSSVTNKVNALHFAGELVKSKTTRSNIIQVNVKGTMLQVIVANRFHFIRDSISLNISFEEDTIILYLYNTNRFITVGTMNLPTVEETLGFVTEYLKFKEKDFGYSTREPYQVWRDKWKTLDRLK